MNDTKPNLVELAKQGLAGVCVLLIILVAFMYYKTCETQDKVFNLMENHFTHNTKALEQLKASVDDNTDMVKEVKQYLFRINGN